MLKVAIICACTCIAVVTTVLNSRDAKERKLLTKEEYSVYSAALESLNNWGKAGILVVSDIARITPSVRKTIEQQRSSWIAREPLLSEEMLADMLSKTDGHLEGQGQILAVSNQHQFVKAQEIEEMVVRGNDPHWKPFYDLYPDSPGLITISRVGFSRKLDAAILYISRQCGALCGEGFCLVLKKEGNSWLVSHRFDLWVS